MYLTNELVALARGLGRFGASDICFAREYDLLRRLIGPPVAQVASKSVVQTPVQPGFKLFFGGAELIEPAKSLKRRVL